MRSLLCLLLLSATASAQAPAKSASPIEAGFRRLDKNKDGKISKEELDAQKQSNFGKVDADKDGTISLEEHTRFMQRSAANRPGQPLSEKIVAHWDQDYAGSKNPRQALDLYLPKTRSRADKPLPVIVFIHGGGWQQGDKAGGYRQVLSYVESGEYAGASIGYRLTDEAQWPAQLHDCKAGIRWLRAHAKEHGLDPEKIAVWGSSAGGHLVSILGTTSDAPEQEGKVGQHLDQKSHVQAVVNYFGPENFLSMVNQPSSIDRTVEGYPEALLIGGRVQDKPEAARAASPITYITSGDPPVLTAHGTEDPLVPFAQATEFHQRLKLAKIPATLLTMQGGGHGFAHPQLTETVQKFLAKHLLGHEAELQDAVIQVGQ
jgi:acetyl esterase/lipase